MSAYTPSYNSMPEPRWESIAQQPLMSGDTIKPTFIGTNHVLENEKRLKRKYYTPTELRSPVLIAFCFLTLGIFVMLQLGASAYVGAPGLHALAARSAQSETPTPDCPPGATCAPAPGSWTDPNETPSPSPTAPTTPPPGSFSDPEDDPASPSPTPEAPTAPSPGSWTGTGDWHASYYFLGAYLPTLVAIVFSIWWKCIFRRLKEMQPFYQMAKPGGAEAGNSILLSYPGASLPKVLWASLVARNWLSFLGAVNMSLITICTLFASETLFISSSGDTCGVIVNTTADSNTSCHMHLTMRPALACVLGVVLFTVFVVTVVAIVRLRSSVSGIMAEATSIAGIASLYNVDMARESARSLYLRSRRYALSPCEAKETNAIVETTSALSHAPSDGFAQPCARGKKQSHPSMHPVALVTFWLFLAGVLILILYYRFVSKPGTNNVLEDFMDSQTFGVRLFMTALGLAIKFNWGYIEDYIRRVGPYVALASPNGATAEQSVLLRQPSNPLTALFCRNTWRSALLGVVTLMAVLSEVLVITLNAIPFTTATAYIAFEASVHISVAILVSMCLTVPAVLVWKTGCMYRVELPGVPECIADVFALLGESAAWRELGLMARKERDRVVRSWQVRFALRKMREGEEMEFVWRLVMLPSVERSA